MKKVTERVANLEKRFGYTNVCVIWFPTVSISSPNYFRFVTEQAMSVQLF